MGHCLLPSRLGMSFINEFYALCKLTKFIFLADFLDSPIKQAHFYGGLSELVTGVTSWLVFKMSERILKHMFF